MEWEYLATTLIMIAAVAVVVGLLAFALARYL